MPEAEEHRPRILLIEDDQDSRRCIERILIRMGAEVATADSADAGLALVAKLDGRIRMCLCDYIMPNKTGVEFYIELAGRSPGCDFYKFLYTTRPDRFGTQEKGSLKQLGVIIRHKPEQFEDLVVDLRELMRIMLPNYSKSD